MKNNYLSLTVCLLLFAGVSLAQEAYITGTAKFKVEPNTLVYFGDDLNLTAAVNQQGVVENGGNIKIDGNFTNLETALNGTNFLSTWTTEDDYGQVIINDGKSANMLAMEKGVIDPVTFNWGQFAIPFNFTNTNEAMQFLFGGPYQNGSNRYTASMMSWNNTSKPQFDHLNSASTLSAGDYVILNLTYNSAGIKSLMTNSTKLTYSGSPSNAVYSRAMGTNNYYPGDNWSVWKEKKNDYNERYKTYIEDQIRDGLTDPDYGKYVYQYGNPYTSNIDLSDIGSVTGYDDGVFIQDLRGVFKLNDLTWSPIIATGGSTSQGSFKATFNGTTWAGDKEALIVKPFEPFVLVLNSNTSQNFQFSDKLKTFSHSARTTPSPLPFGKNQSMDGGADYGTEGSNGDFYQLRLNLFNADGTSTGNRVYVVVASNVMDGEDNNFEAEYFDFNNRTGFFLAQEDPEGLPVKTSSRKMDINAVSPDFVNKPIPMFLNRTTGDPSGYYLKADLFYQSIFNQLNAEDENYADGNSFYFYDDKEDVMLPITTDFAYYIAPDDVYGEKLKYEIYWNAEPVVKDEMGTNDELAASTIIYKNQNVHQVKFNVNWTSADLKVYDLSGRNIQTFENVNTKSDFSIKVPNGVYVVRIKSNTGEVYTQKIIK